MRATLRIADAGPIGRQGVQIYLAALRERARDCTPAWNGVLSELRAQESLVFAQQGAIGGAGLGQWAPLSTRYAAWKAKHYPGRPLLVLTGELRSQLTEVSARQYLRFGPQNLVWGTDYPIGHGSDLGGIHADPEEFGRPDLPRRTPIEIDEATGYAIAGPIIDHVTNITSIRGETAEEGGMPFVD